MRRTPDSDLCVYTLDAGLDTGVEVLRGGLKVVTVTWYERVATNAGGVWTYKRTTMVQVVSIDTLIVTPAAIALVPNAPRTRFQLSKEVREGILGVQW